MNAIQKAGYTGKIQVALNVAASEFYRDGKYDLDFKNPDSDPTTWVSISSFNTRNQNRAGVLKNIRVLYRSLRTL